MSERLVVVVRVTGRCNLACGFCAFDRRLAFERHELRAETLLRLGTLLAEHRDSASLQVHLSLLGGEPTLWEPLEPTEARLAQELGLSLGLTTNGTALASASFRKRLLSHYDELTLSVDAPGRVHDALRSFPNGFARLEAGVRALVRERAHSGRPLLIRVNTVLMQRTLPSFDELCARLADWGVDEVTFNALGGVDRPEFFAAERLLPKHLEELRRRLPGLRAKLAARGVVLRGGDAYLRRLLSAAERRALPVLDCNAGERFLFVDHLGRVSPCSFTAAEYGVPIEALSGAEALSYLSGRFKSAQRHARSTQCDDCRSTQVFSKWALPTASSLERPSARSPRPNRYLKRQPA